MSTTQSVLDFYNKKKFFIETEPWGNGHINDTFRIKASDGETYILQKINTNVFQNPEGIVSNHIKLIDEIKKSGTSINIPNIIRTDNGTAFVWDNDNNFWRMTEFVKDSYSIDKTTNNNQAYEAGKGFGWFVYKTSGLNPNEFTEAIPYFHSLEKRMGQLNESIEKNTVNRLSQVQNTVQFYLDFYKTIEPLADIINEGNLPLRVVHNDTKINNLLFRNEKAVAVIDLDTVGPGYIIYDFGDGLRTIANDADENEQNLEKVSFNLDWFKDFSKGFIHYTAPILSDSEKKHLWLAPFYMTFIMGIRFLTDYLNGDIYYKIKYDEHNLTRSLVQQKLLISMHENSEKMQDFLKDIFYKSI